MSQCATEWLLTGLSAMAIALLVLAALREQLRSEHWARRHPVERGVSMCLLLVSVFAAAGISLACLACALGHQDISVFSLEKRLDAIR